MKILSHKLLIIALAITFVSPITKVSWLPLAHAEPIPIPEDLASMPADFTLQSSDGPVSLQDFRGKVVLLFFGYTHCPDACPSTLRNWALAFKRLEKENLENVHGLFVSVDPERDTPETLKDYTSYFHPNISGVTGDHEILSFITMFYRANYDADPPDENGEYAVNHNGLVYVIGPNSKVRDLLSFQSQPDEFSQSILNVLKEN